MGKKYILLYIYGEDLSYWTGNGLCYSSQHLCKKSSVSSDKSDGNGLRDGVAVGEDEVHSQADQVASYTKDIFSLIFCCILKWNICCENVILLLFSTSPSARPKVQRIKIAITSNNCPICLSCNIDFAKVFVVRYTVIFQLKYCVLSSRKCNHVFLFCSTLVKETSQLLTGISFGSNLPPPPLQYHITFRTSLLLFLLCKQPVNACLQEEEGQ